MSPGPIDTLAALRRILFDLEEPVTEARDLLAVLDALKDLPGDYKEGEPLLLGIHRVTNDAFIASERAAVLWEAAFELINEGDA